MFWLICSVLLSAGIDLLNNNIFVSGQIDFHLVLDFLYTFLYFSNFGLSLVFRDTKIILSITL